MNSIGELNGILSPIGIFISKCHVLKLSPPPNTNVFFFYKTWIFIFNSVFLNYSTPIKANTEKELKMVKNLENQATFTQFSFFGLFKYIHAHMHARTVIRKRDTPY